MGNVLEAIHTADILAPTADAMPGDLAEYEDAENPEVRGGGWHIQTIQSADWALLRLAECEAEAEEIERQAQAAIRRVRERADALKQKVGRGVAYFRFKLMEYAETHRTEIVRGKKKSKDFLHGRIGFRAKPERLVVTDPAALEAWLVAQPVEEGLYRTKIEPEMAELNRRLKENGEVPPGCSIKVEPESIEIKAAAPEAALAKE